MQTRPSAAPSGDASSPGTEMEAFLESVLLEALPEGFTAIRHPSKGVYFVDPAGATTWRHPVTGRSTFLRQKTAPPPPPPRAPGGAAAVPAVASSSLEPEI